jgi:hypothetical protein
MPDLDLSTRPRVRCACGRELRRLHRIDRDGKPKGDRDGWFWGCPECEVLLSPRQFSRAVKDALRRWYNARRSAGLEPVQEARRRP